MIRPIDRRSFHVHDMTVVNKGWRWKVTFRHQGQQLTNTYCTDTTGRGLWASQTPDDRYQLRKLDEFSLPTHRTGALEKVKKFFEERESQAKRELKPTN